MSKLNDFYTMYGEGDKYSDFTTEQVDKWKGRLPDFLLEEWHTKGLRSFENGFIWFTNPDYFQHPLSEWLPESDNFSVYARSAFCDLWIWDGEKTLLLDVHYARLVSFRMPVELILNFTLVQHETRKDMLNIDTFNKVKRRIGSPDWDEMYAYVPAIALGGSMEEVDSIDRVKVVEHMSFLSQLHDEIITI